MTNEETDRTQHGGWDPIVRHYEKCLDLHGASPRGVDWPNGSDLAVRFGVLLELLADAGSEPVVLDLGCGPGLLVDYLADRNETRRLQYYGIDLSPAMIRTARTRWPQHRFECRDILQTPLPDKSVDIVIMNGVLTERVSLSVESMTDLAQALVKAAFKAARVGIAFNAMSVHVDWQRDDLFHWSFDALASFLKRDVSKHYEFRADYGLYEYICAVRREPRRPAGPRRETWWNP